MGEEHREEAFGPGTYSILSHKSVMANPSKEMIQVG
jgi:hypothetical protein